MRAAARRAGAIGLEVWLPVLLVAAWWFGSAGSDSPYFPPLSAILDRFVELWLFDRVVADLLPSLRNLGLGYGIALTVGIAAGVALGLAPRTARALSPLLEIARALPAVVLLPLALLLFGTGAGMAVAVIAFGAVWPVLLNALDGVRGVEPVLHDVSRAFRLARRRHVLSIVLPGAAPQIVAGARTGLSIAVILVVVSELVGSSQGVGNFVLTAQRTFAITNMWTGMIVLGIVGYLLNVAFRVVEGRLLRWHPAHRADGGGA